MLPFYFQISLEVSHLISQFLILVLQKLKLAGKSTDFTNLLLDLLILLIKAFAQLLSCKLFIAMSM